MVNAATFPRLKASSPQRGIEREAQMSPKLDRTTAVLIATAADTPGPPALHVTSRTTGNRGPVAPTPASFSSYLYALYMMTGQVRPPIALISTRCCSSDEEVHYIPRCSVAPKLHSHNGQIRRESAQTIITHFRGGNCLFSPAQLLPPSVNRGQPIDAFLA